MRRPPRPKPVEPDPTVHEFMRRQRLRRRAAAAAAEAAAPRATPCPAPRPLWLDALPPEVCVRVALFVSRSERAKARNHQCPSLLALAELAPRFRAAAAEALAFEVAFPTDHNARWAAVFRGCVRAVSTDTLLFRPLLPLLKAKSLRVAYVSNWACHLDSVAKARNLRELSIEITQHANPACIYHALGRLTIQKLRLSCREGAGSLHHMCVFRGLCASKAACGRLARRCTSVSSLELVCICMGSGRHVDLRPFSGAFPRLRELAINRPVTLASIPFLQALDSVIFREFRVPSNAQVVLAGKIGHSMTAIETDLHGCTNAAAVSAADVQGLARCPRFARLSTCLKSGAEHSLPPFKELQSLQLQWDYAYFRDNSAAFGTVEKHHVPAPDFFRTILEGSPNLRELCLFKLRIPIAEITTICESIGRRMTVLGTSIVDQEEPPLQRIVAVMNIVRQHNPSLRRLEICESTYARPDALEKDAKVMWVRRVDVALNLLRSAAPMLDVEELRADLHYWLMA